MASDMWICGMHSGGKRLHATCLGPLSPHRDPSEESCAFRPPLYSHHISHIFCCVKESIDAK